MWRVMYSIAATLNTVAWGIYFSFTRRYIGVELGGGLHAILLVTGLEWFYVLFAPASGRISRAVGGRNVVRAGIAGALPLAVSVLLRDPLQLAVVLSLTSLVWSITWPSVMATVFSGAEGRFGRAYSIFTVGTGFGWSVGSFLMGLIYYAGGPGAVLLTCSALHAATYAIFSAFYPTEGTGGADRGDHAATLVSSLRYVLVAYALIVFCREAYYSVAPVKLSEEILRVAPGAPEGLQYLLFGLLYGGLTALLSIPARLLSGSLADRYDPRALLAVSFALYTACYWSFVLTEGLVSILVWQLPLYPLVDTSVNVLLARGSTEGSRAQALGVGLMFSALGGLGVLPLVAYPDVDPVAIGVLVSIASAAGLALVGADARLFGRR